jgi:hypothetical protein
VRPAVSTACTTQGAAVEIGDEKVRARYEYKARGTAKRSTHKIAEISSSRSYRIVGAMQAIAESIEMDARHRVLQADAVLMVLLLAAVIYGAQAMSGGFRPLLQLFQEQPVASAVGAVVLLAVLLGVHFLNRGWAARRIARSLPDETSTGNWRAAFLKNTVFWRSIFRKSPTGLGHGAIRQLHALRDRVEAYVQRLNNQFMDEGAGAAQPQAGIAEPAVGEEPATSEAGSGNEESQRARG